MRRKLGLLPLSLLISAFLIVPLLVMVIGSFSAGAIGGFTLDNYKEIFLNTYYSEAFLNSLLIGVLSSLLGLVGAYVISYCLLEISSKKQEKIVLISNLAGNFAGIPLAFSFIILLGNAGVLKMMLPILEQFNLYSWWGLSLVYMYFQIPLGILFLYPSMKETKKEWREMAQVLGASEFYYWRKIELSFLKPAIINTFIILFANGVGTYETVYALTGNNVNLLTIRISALVAGDVFANPNLGSALSVVFGVFMVILMWIFKIERRKDKII